MGCTEVTPHPLSANAGLPAYHFACCLVLFFILIFFIQIVRFFSSCILYLTVHVGVHSPAVLCSSFAWNPGTTLCDVSSHIPPYSTLNKYIELCALAAILCCELIGIKNSFRLSSQLRKNT